jgi:hypothetical protein
MKSCSATDDEDETSCRIRKYFAVISVLSFHLSRMKWKKSKDAVREHNHLFILIRKLASRSTEERRKQLLDDLNETRKYWKLKQEALDPTQWRTGFGRSNGLVVDRLRDKINYMGPGLLSQCSDSVQAGRFRFESRWGQSFPLLHTGPHETGTGPTQPVVHWIPGGRSRRQSDRSMALTTHSLHLASSF